MPSKSFTRIGCSIDSLSAPFLNNVGGSTSNLPLTGCVWSCSALFLQTRFISSLEFLQWNPTTDYKSSLRSDEENGASLNRFSISLLKIGGNKSLSSNQEMTFWRIIGFIKDIFSLSLNCFQLLKAHHM